jgi:formamidopyrimidine-DNA glycosylase
MPELPDLEVFKQNLLKLAINKVITEGGCNAPKSLINSSLSDFTRITTNEKFTDVNRRGKHLIFSLSSKAKLVLHLMLHGKFEYGSKTTDHAPSECFWFAFSDGNELKVIDRTRWVKLEVQKEGNLEKSKLLKGLGPEADEIGLKEFRKIIKSSRLGRIKPILMDQKKIAGLGNAYTDEILWKSKIHPNRTASLLKDAEIKTLHANIKKVLDWGIENNKKEVGNKLCESKRGWMNVYRKKSKECPKCRTKIKQTKVNQRDTFYCPKCQKREK